MIASSFFQALARYAYAEAKLNTYERRRIQANTLKALDRELIAEARERNAAALQDAWYRLTSA
jgi:hypothetical protein